MPQNSEMLGFADVLLWKDAIVLTFNHKLPIGEIGIYQSIITLQLCPELSLNIYKPLFKSEQSIISCSFLISPNFTSLPEISESE